MNAARLLYALAASICLSIQPGLALASEYPSKPIRIVVPFPAGGAVDVVARMVAHRLQLAWGQPVVVLNSAGAAGNIGAQTVARATPDGYTLLAVAAGLMTANEFIYPNRGFSAIKDFAPISNVVDAPHILMVNSTTPVSTVKELVQLAKREPGKVTFGNAGIGTASHLAAENLALRAGVEFLHVSYKGTPPATAALLGGEVNASIDGMVTFVPHIKAGKLKALGIATAQRLPLLPDVPTISESGIPGFESGTWLGIVAPAGTSMDIRRRIQGEIAAMLKIPDVERDLLRQGLIPVGSTPEAFSEFILAEREKARVVVETAKIPVQ